MARRFDTEYVVLIRFDQPIEVPGGQTRIVAAEYKDPINESEFIGAINVLQPATPQDWTANRVRAGHGHRFLARSSRSSASSGPPRAVSDHHQQRAQPALGAWPLQSGPLPPGARQGRLWLSAGEYARRQSGQHRRPRQSPLAVAAPDALSDRFQRRATIWRRLSPRSMATSRGNRNPCAWRMTMPRSKRSASSATSAIASPCRSMMSRSRWPSMPSRANSPWRIGC